MATTHGLADVPLGDSAPKPQSGPVSLEWQSFPTSTGAAAATAARSPVAADEPAGAAASGGAPVGSPLPVAEAIAHPLACFSPSFYTHMFDVKTAEVVERLKAAMWPLQRNTFLNTIGSKPDFYGPTWIAATLVFVIGAGSNLSSWLSFTPGGAVSIWKYDFRLVTFALMAVYAFAFGVSSAFFLALNYLGVSGLPLVYLVCIYGYSLSIFIPAALVSVLPNTGLQWTVAIFAAALSALFVFKSVFPVVRDSGSHVAARVAIPAIVLVQLGFAMLLKLYFFSF